MTEVFPVPQDSMEGETAKPAKFQSELHSAIEAGDEKRVAALLAAGADIEEQNWCSWTPLMAASMRGQVDIACLLLNQKANVHAASSEGRTAIHYAGMCGGADAVRLLLRFGADVNMVTDSAGGYVPLHLAAAHCNRSIVEETCAALLAAGADVNARSKSGATALWFACISSRRDLVNYLLSRGAGLEVRDNEERTLLIQSVRQTFVMDYMITHLLSRGANVDSKDVHGRTSLMYAALSGRRFVIDALLDGGADINCQDCRGSAPLMFAAGESPKPSTIGMLGRERSTTPDGDDKAPKWNPEKRSDRLAKAYQARAEIVRHLIARGADKSMRDNEGRTALDIALENAQTIGNDNADVIGALTH